MGQRHQAFVIARIRPHGDRSTTSPQYRCIAAFHHQWCYGRLPLHATNRFISQIKHRDNAPIVLAEIAAIQGQYGRWRKEPRIPQVPCPYIAFLLATNWCVDLEDPQEAYISGVSFSNAILFADMGSAQGDNNDGISIIDVTDPYAPSYCFVASGSRRPLTAEQYVRLYYDKYAIPSNLETEETEEQKNKRLVEEDVQATIALLDDYKLLDLQMLAEAWPAEYEKQHRQSQQNKAPSESALPDVLLSLADMAITPAVVHAVKSDDTVDIEGMVWMPGKADTIKTALRAQTPFPNSALTLLKKIIAHDLEEGHSLDLSGFTLSTEQISKLVVDVEKAESLNLSQNPAITIDGVRAVLAAIPLKRIILLGCPSVSSEDVKNLVESEPKLFYHLDAFVHPFFLGVLKDGEVASPYTNAFSYIGIHKGMGGPLKAASLPFFTPENIIHALYDYLAALFNEDDFFSDIGPSLPMQAALASVRKPDQKWSERSTAVVPQLGLGALDGEGWTFMTHLKRFGGYGSYAFVKFALHPLPESEEENGRLEVMAANFTGKPDESKGVKPFWEIHDLSSFLAQMTLEGRPNPPDVSVAKLQGVLDNMQGESNLMVDDNVIEVLSQIPRGIAALHF